MTPLFGCNENEDTAGRLDTTYFRCIWCFLRFVFKSMSNSCCSLQHIFSTPPQKKNIIQKRMKEWGDKCQQPGVTCEFSKKSEQHAPPAHTRHGKHGRFGGGYRKQICFGSKAEPAQAFPTIHQLDSQWRYHGI